MVEEAIRDRVAEAVKEVFEDRVEQPVFSWVAEHIDGLREDVARLERRLADIEYMLKLLVRKTEAGKQVA
jgi:hypothetical protein